MSAAVGADTFQGGAVDESDSEGKEQDGDALPDE
jgi:hypothetical protein